MASAERFHTTVDAGVKYAPLTVSVNAAAPAVTAAGTDQPLRPLAWRGRPANVTGFVTRPLGLVTVLAIAPAFTSRLAGTVALKSPESPNVVPTAVPFHRATQLEAKLLPVMRIVTPPSRPRRRKPA